MRAGQRVPWITRKATSRGRRGRSWQSALPPTKVGGGVCVSSEPSVITKEVGKEEERKEDGGKEHEEEAKLALG